MKFSNIILDFDGTLFDTAPGILATMRVTISQLGLPARSETECRSTIGLRLQDIPAKLFPEHHAIGDIYAAAYRENFERLKKTFRPTPFDGVEATLEKLHSRGIRMAIASSRSHKSLAEMLDVSQMAQYFSMIVGGDDVEHGKPSPDPALAIINRLGWQPAETLVAGDADVDIIMGKAAGCATCGVTYGNGTYDEIQRASPTIIIDAFGRLADHVEA